MAFHWQEHWCEGNSPWQKQGFTQQAGRKHPNVMKKSQHQQDRPLLLPACCHVTLTALLTSDRRWVPVRLTFTMGFSSSKSIDLSKLGHHLQLHTGLTRAARAVPMQLLACTAVLLPPGSSCQLQSLPGQC